MLLLILINLLQVETVRVVLEKVNKYTELLALVETLTSSKDQQEMKWLSCDLLEIAWNYGPLLAKTSSPEKTKHLRL